MVFFFFFNAELRFLTLKRESCKGMACAANLGTILPMSKVLISTLVVDGVLFCTVKICGSCLTAVLLWLWLKFLMFEVDAVFRGALY